MRRRARRRRLAAQAGGQDVRVLRRNRDRLRRCADRKLRSRRAATLMTDQAEAHRRPDPARHNIASGCGRTAAAVDPEGRHELSAMALAASEGNEHYFVGGVAMGLKTHSCARRAPEVLYWAVGSV